MKENCRDDEQKVPRRVSRMAKGTAFTLRFMNGVFCDVKYEKGENYKESGVFS